MAEIDRGTYSWTWDNYLESNMRIILERAIPNKWDALFIIFGREGSGKTTVGTQVCTYLDPTFDLDRVCFKPDQFLAAVDNAKPEEAILWDEAIYGANAAQWANEISQAVISRLTTIRKRKLKIVICFPYLYMLNKYFISRSLASIYVYAKAFDKRGFMSFYNQRKTEYLYELMKSKYSYNWQGAIKRVLPSFHCKFPNYLCLPEEMYEDKKDRSTSSENTSKKEEIHKELLVKLIIYLSKNKIMSFASIAKAMETYPNKITNLVRDIVEKDGPQVKGHNRSKLIMPNASKPEEELQVEASQEELAEF